MKNSYQLELDMVIARGEDARDRTLSILQRVENLTLLELDLLESEKEVTAGKSKIDASRRDAVYKFGSLAAKLKVDQLKADKELLALKAEENSSVDYDRAAVFLNNLKFIIDRIRHYAPSTTELIGEHIQQIAEDFKDSIK